MNANPPKELQDLMETVDEMFRYVKAQARLARESFEQGGEPRGDADETERCLFARLLQLGLRLMEMYLGDLDQGNLGYRVEFGGVEYERKHTGRDATLLTVFGIVHYLQSVYYADGEDSMRPLAAMANLPERRSSYFAQELMMRLGTEESYAESKAFYRDIFGHSLSPRTIEQVVEDAAESCGDCYSSSPIPPPSEEGEIAVVSFDGKGILVVPAERTTGKTREALLGCAYTAERERRDPKRLAYSLVPLEPDPQQDGGQSALNKLAVPRVFPQLVPEEEAEQGRREARARNISYWGSVLDSKETVFGQVQETANARFAASGISEVVCLIDGAPGLWRLAKEHFPDAVHILDIMHVLKYLWQATSALSPDPDGARVLANLFLNGILLGNVGRVIGGMRIRLTKNRIKGQRRKDVEAAITYFENHREYMHYDRYLAAGYPVASGVIESACGHLVKDRMDKAGAQWSLNGAEAVLKLRCIRANGHWSEFQQKRQENERKRLYARFLDVAA